MEDTKDNLWNWVFEDITWCPHDWKELMDLLKEVICSFSLRVAEPLHAKLNFRVIAVEFCKAVVTNSCKKYHPECLFSGCIGECLFSYVAANQAGWTYLYLTVLLHFWKCAFISCEDPICALGTQIWGITKSVLLHWVVVFGFQWKQHSSFCHWVLCLAVQWKGKRA